MGLASASVFRTARKPQADFRSGQTAGFRQRPADASSRREALQTIGDALIGAAHAGGEPVSVVMFEQVDLPELHAIFGGAAAAAVAASFADKLRALVRPRGFAGRAGATTWVVVLPGLDKETALALVEQSLGKSLATEVGGSDEILLVPRIAVLTTTEKPQALRDILHELTEEIVRAHAHEVRHKQLLRRERERHTKPRKQTSEACENAVC